MHGLISPAQPGRTTLIERERKVLRELASGVPLPEVLDHLLSAVEADASTEMLASILFVTDDGQQLLHGAAPSLPEDYNNAIHGIRIGEGVGSCGTAIARAAPVYVTDIANDPLWVDFRDLAMSFGLRACWSTPIKAADGHVLGTFAIYYREPRAPTDEDVAAIDFITQTAALAIERHRSDQELLKREAELKRLNAELELRAQRQQATFQQMPGFVAILEGPEHVFTYVNEAYRKLVGPREFIGRPAREVLPEVEGQGFFELLDGVFSTGERFVSRAAPIRLHGEEFDRYLDFVYEPVRDSDGSITGIFAGGYDVTEQKRADVRRAALIRLTDDIRDLEVPEDIAYAAARVLGETLNVSRTGYGTIDTVNETVTIDRDWSAPGVKTLAGVLHFREYGSYIEDLKRGETVIFADAETDPRTSATAEALRSIDAVSLVNMPVTERGRFVALLYIANATAREWPQDDLEFIREVAGRTRTATERARVATELRRRELELSELNEQLERRVEEALAEQRILADIIESTDAFIQVVDMDFNWLAVNRASADEFERIFGVRPKAGDNMLDCLSHLPEEQAAVRAVWERALTGEAFTQIDDFGDPDLDRRYYEMKFSPLHDDDGALIGAYQFVFDVTERLKNQARLEQAEEQLRQAQKMEAVGQLTGGVAHDFNNMLAVVSGSLELLDRRTKDDERAKRLISSALEATKRATNLTQRLLAFSRQQPLQPQVLEVNKLVAGMSDLFRHSLGADIQLETVFSGGLWRIHADQNQLENVLLNLAVNARDAMPGGGRLTIETQNAHLDQRYVAQEPGVMPGQYVLIAITDSGTGMPPEVIAKAFDPFFTTKDVGKGTGLGLSQVYGFVKQSGGHIKIYSEVGQGTTIKIYLPRHVGDGFIGEDEETAGNPQKSDGRELILVVDDEDLVRQLSVEALIDLGYRVLEASSAQAALTVLIERPDVDLLFTDIVMPEMNGRKLADLVHEKRPDLPVLYTTGYTRNAVVHNGVVDAGVELIGKPFTLDELATRVRAILDGALLKTSLAKSSRLDS